jgi:hypothetical protein
MDEIKRVYVLQQVEEKKLSGREAAQRLGLLLRIYSPVFGLRSFVGRRRSAVAGSAVVSKHR